MLMNKRRLEEALPRAGGFASAEAAARAINLNPAVGFELRDGFAAVYNQCGQLTPGQGAAAGVVGGLSGNVAALR